MKAPTGARMNVAGSHFFTRTLQNDLQPIAMARRMTHA